MIKVFSNISCAITGNVSTHSDRMATFNINDIGRVSMTSAKHKNILAVYKKRQRRSWYFRVDQLSASDVMDLIKHKYVY